MRKRKKEKCLKSLRVWWVDVVIYFAAVAVANTVRLSHSFCQFGPPAANTLKAANVTKPVNCDQFCLCRWRRTRSRSLSALCFDISNSSTHTHTHMREHTHACKMYQKVLGNYYCDHSAPNIHIHNYETHLRSKDWSGNILSVIQNWWNAWKNLCGKAKNMLSMKSKLLKRL